MLTKHLPGRHVTVSHDALTIRTPRAATEHRALCDGEIEEWRDAPHVPLTSEERTALLARVAAPATA